jgi:hypothetical protein
MRLILGHYAVNGTRSIGDFLVGAEAMAKLKEILRAYMRARNGQASAEKMEL